MRKTKEVPVVWHKGWPPVPTDHTCYQYLLTVKRNDELEVVIDWYLSNSVFEKTCEDDVVAWAELPEPFDPKQGQKQGRKRKRNEEQNLLALRLLAGPFFWSEQT